MLDIATSHASAPEQSNSMNSRNCWSGPCWRKFDKSCVAKVTGLIFSQNYRNYPIYGTMETMFIEGFHWNMHGICLATLLLTLQFHNAVPGILHQCCSPTAWVRHLEEVADQSCHLTTNSGGSAQFWNGRRFELDEVSHRHGTLRKSHGLIKTRLTPVIRFVGRYQWSKLFFSGLCTGLFAEQKAARSLVIIELYFSWFQKVVNSDFKKTPGVARK